MIYSVAFCNEEFWRKAYKNRRKITHDIAEEFVLAGGKRNPDNPFYPSPNMFLKLMLMNYLASLKVSC